MKTIIPVAVALSLVSLTDRDAHAVLTLIDGASHTVNATVNNVIIDLEDTSGLGTSVTFDAGAAITGRDDVGDFDESVFAGGQSTVTINEGTFTFSVAAADDASVDVSGGTFTTTLTVYGNAVSTIEGGSFGIGVESFDTAVATVRGGNFSASAEGFLTYDGGTIILEGSGFSIGGTPVPDGPITATTGMISGTLANGTSINNVAFDRDFLSADFGSSPGTIQIITVPEPAAPAFLALATFGLALRRLR